MTFLASIRKLGWMMCDADGESEGSVITVMWFGFVIEFAWGKRVPADTREDIAR